MEKPPPVKARFFYTSLLAIDDPLSPVPPPASTLSSSKQGPRPFSEYDNSRLEDAWHKNRRKLAEERAREQEKPAGSQETKRSQSISAGRSGSRTRSVAQPPPFASWNSGRQKARHDSVSRPGAGGSVRQRGRSVNEREEQPSIDELLVESELPDTTGTPFIRAPSRKQVPTVSNVRAEQTSRPRPQPLDSYVWDDDTHKSALRPEATTTKNEATTKTAVSVGVSRLHQVTIPQLNMEPIYWSPINDISPVMRATWFYKDTMLPVEAPVANMLELGYCELQVWSRTWQDELDSAAEVGAAGEERILRKLWPVRVVPPPSRPGTSNGTYTDLSSSVDQIPTSKEQLREQQVGDATVTLDKLTSHDGEDLTANASTTYQAAIAQKWYSSAGIIYADKSDAYILKSTLQPSAYYGRRPLASYIRRGRKLGIPVVRGFDQEIWDKLHPPPKGSKAAKAYAGVSSNEAGPATDDVQFKNPQLAASVSPEATDLVLVIHGIGQKLSERMESFHFTHAMNAFRREVNVELGSDIVRKRLRPGAGGIMVLPVNWRQSLSFEEGGYKTEEDSLDNQYGLKDITPETLPSVRGIVSDVMLDIPYYLSHHQPKMIAAVIREANRIYGLWCSNNPGFAETGRVHIIAHSLGSVMALDILSKQPTHLPSHLSDPSSSSVPTNLDHFMFPVSNLFVAGSPAGFFLLLKRAALRPRIDHKKVKDDSELNVAAVCGKQGDYGCVAVENIYNIMNPYDPVSYRLNATVDAVYAASLRPAWVPSATPGWFGSSSTEPSSGMLSGLFGSSSTSLQSARPGLPPPKKSSTATTAMHPLASSAATPDDSEEPSMLPRLPSNVELETHNFTREEIAEKRMYALNDNGQIDYMLKYGGGPLEIQYLTMLGAHSSYWLLKDFVRVVVLEIGREPGRTGVGRGMAAVKKRAL